LDRVSPRLALIPAGYLNRFGFPHPAVIARYQAHHIAFMTAGETGAITIDIGANPGMIVPLAFRQQSRHYWMMPQAAEPKILLP
ncbi:MAG: hypothetical protein LUO80_02390, partial [Methylococcaceae bacterium]|nr:hypothetical protein [Methylococcaceae bacterium]